MGSRNTRSSQTQDNSSSTVDNNTEQMESGSDDEPDLVRVLSHLLRSGQVQLIRSSSGVGGGIHIVHGFPNSDSDDDEDEYEDDDGLVWYNDNTRNRPQQPPTVASPDTSKLKGSYIRQQLMLSSGQTIKKMNIARKLQMRETGINRQPNFYSGDCAMATSDYLPNTMTIKAKYRQKAFCGTYSQDGTVFLSACQDEVIRLYDTTNGQFRKFQSIQARDIGWSIIDTAFSPDQQYFIYSSWSDYIHLCNIYGDYNTHVALDLRPQVSRFCAFTTTFSHNNQEILAGGNDACLYIYDRGSEQRTLRIEGHEDDLGAVKFADPSSQIFYSAGDDGLCKVWDRRTLDESCPEPVGILSGHADGITSIASKDDGRHLITNSKDQTIKLWDIRKFSNAEGILATKRAVAGQRWDYRWQRAPRKSLRSRTLQGDASLMTYRGHSVLNTLIRCYFSPAHTTGQRYIYTGCSTGSVVIYDIITGKIAARLSGHNSCVRDVSWHPYENNIVSSSWDGTLGLWQFERNYDPVDVEFAATTPETPPIDPPPPKRRSRRLLNRH